MTHKKNEKQTMCLQLEKSSSPEQIKAYFAQVINLKNCGEDFPIDLEDVFPLLYHDKKKAVEELGKFDEFGNERYIKGIDYQASPQMVEAGPGTSKKIVYKLSLECMEWFVARKVRSVFNIYREVFHAVVEGSVSFGNRKYISIGEFCNRYHKTTNSFYGFLSHYPCEFLFANGIWSISTDLCKIVELKQTLESKRVKLRELNDSNQLKLNFKE